MMKKNDVPHTDTPVAGPRFSIVTTLLSLSLSQPVLLVTIPPLADLPGHVGRFYLQSNDADALLRGIFHYHWQLSGNLGCDILVYLLAHILPLETAARLVVAAIPVLMGIAMLLIAREAHGKLPVTAPLALPLTYAWPFQMGFINYWLSVALAFLAFAWWMRARRTRWRLLTRTLTSVALACIVWTAHVAGWGVFIVLCWTYEFVQARDTRILQRFAMACWKSLPVGAPLILMIFWRNGEGFPFAEWPRRGTKLIWFVGTLRDRWLLLDLGSLGILLAVIVFPFFRPRRFGHSKTLFACGMMLLLVAAIGPELVLNSMFAASRLFAVGLALLVLSVRVSDSLTPRAVTLIAWASGSFCLVRIVASILSYQAYDQAFARELSLLDRIPGHVRVAAFVGQPCAGRLDNWTKARLEHLPVFAIIRKNDFVNALFAGPGYSNLVIDYPPAGQFVDESSSHVSREAAGCPSNFPYGLLTSLSTLPFDAFDYIWLINVPPEIWPRLPNATLMVRRNQSVLYRVNHAPSGPAFVVPGASVHRVLPCQAPRSSSRGATTHGSFNIRDAAWPRMPSSAGLL